MELGVSAIVLQGAEFLRTGGRSGGGWRHRGVLQGLLPGQVLQRLAVQIFDDVDEEEIFKVFFQDRVWVQQHFK